MREKLWGLVLLLGAFAFYLVQAAPSVTAGDSGEFITAAATLSLAHSPSFPLFMLTGRCFSELLGMGAVAYRLNVFSAFTSALSLLFCYGIGRELKLSHLAAMAISILLGLSTSFWANSLVTEVFSLNTLFTVVLMYLLVRGLQAPTLSETQSILFLFAFVLGLGLGNHHILVFLGMGSLLLLKRVKDLGYFKVILMCCLFGLLGLSIYLSLPLRSVKEPPLNWGQPTTVQKFIRTVTRKDYGSLRLSLDENPPRTMANTIRHLQNFGKEMAKELSWPLLGLCSLGLLIGLWRRSSVAWGVLLLFLLSGPIFYLLGNLPFTGQSEGIMGRFYIMPAFFLLIGLAWYGPRLLYLFPVFLLVGTQKVMAMDLGHRSSTLVLDYGRALFRTMPPRSILFLDGGDDAFYSLAMLHYVERARPDVEIHDRGGLVFKNIYGSDFRSLPKRAKQNRRAEVERRNLGVRPVFYSTMDPHTLPGSVLTQNGFLYEASAHDLSGIPWDLLSLRSLYPTQPPDYRTRALAAFFPYMQGKMYLSKDDYEKALGYFRRAQAIGYDVDWLKVNLGAEYEQWGFNSLNRGRYILAEWVYTQWLQMDSSSMQAHSNLGVVLERLGRLPDARAQYKKAAKLFPNAADPVFNLAVLAWKENKWTEVIELLEEVIRRKPDHAQARGYLLEAKRRARKTP